MKRKIALISDGPFTIADSEIELLQEQRTYVWEIAQNLSQIGYQVDVFTCDDEESQRELEERLEHVRIIHVPQDSSVSRPDHREDLPDAMHVFAGYILRFCSTQDKPYDLVHAVSWGSGWAAVEIKAALGTPFVITFPGREERGLPPQQSSDSFRAQRVQAENRILREADGIVAELPHDREQLVSLYDADPSYIAQISSGVSNAERGGEEHETDESRAMWQRFTSLLVEFYENVLAVRRVAVRQMNLAVPAMGLPGYPDRLQSVDRAFEMAIQTLRESQAALRERILEAAGLMIECLHGGGKIMVCGAGAADADARQFSAELMGRSLLSCLTGLPVLLLSADMRSSVYPANETDRATIFSRQVEALGRPGDLLFGIGGEADLACLAEAFRSARLHNLTCLSLTGLAAEHLAAQTDVALVVPTSNAGRTREVQMLVLGLLCDLVEEQLTGAHGIPAENLYDASGALRLLKRLVE